MQAGGTRSGRLIRCARKDYIQVAKEAPACKYVMPELGNNVRVHSLFNSGDLQVVGALPPFTEIRSITVAQGRFYNEEDNAEARNVAFLGSDAKKQLFAEREALGQTISLNGTPYNRHWSHEAEGTKFQLRWRRRPQDFHPLQFDAPRFSQTSRQPSSTAWTVCSSRPGRWRRILTV